MTRREQIENALRAIDLLTEAIEQDNSDGWMQHRTALRLTTQDHDDLVAVFKESIPATELGRFQMELRHMIVQPIFPAAAEAKENSLKNLGIIRDSIVKHCKYKNLRIFYSWQSDRDNSTNRGFIKKALSDAVEQINAERNLEMFVDHDTRGEGGSPDIVNTILRKIDNSDVIVADLTPISRLGTMELPNPNVLFELGYAIKHLGDKKVIMVFNEAFGIVENLPFDLGLKRQVTYSCLQSDTDKLKPRKKLESTFRDAICAILDS